MQSISKITDPALQRLAFKAGVKSLSHGTYDAMRDVIGHHMTQVINHASVFAINARRSTMREEDVRGALEQMGRPTAVVLSTLKTQKTKKEDGEVSSRTVKVEGGNTAKCHIFLKKSSVKKSESTPVDVLVEESDASDVSDEESDIESESDLSDDEADLDGGAKKRKSPKERKPRRTHPGTVAKRRVKQYGKTSSIRCVQISRAGFRQIVEEIAKAKNPEARLSPEAVSLIQLDVENYVVDLFTKAQRLVAHGERVRLTPEDLKTILAILGCATLAPPFQK